MVPSPQAGSGKIQREWWEGPFARRVRVNATLRGGYDYAMGVKISLLSSSRFAISQLFVIVSLLRWVINAGVNLPSLPCTSIFAVDNVDFVEKKKEYVVLNFMDGGGHYGVSIKKIDKIKWHENLRSVC